MVNIGPERPCSNPSCRNPVHDAQAIKVPGSIDNWVHSKWDAQKCRLAVGIPKLSWSKRQRVDAEQPAAEAEQPQPQAVAVGQPMAGGSAKLRARPEILLDIKQIKNCR